MTSQGQRFRRRALRRGYKVDEVDAFLDRVEATLAGDPIGAPVTAQEVHDVVFRVRFGGYDEWQVDLHLDRVERQLAEQEERGGYARPEGRQPGLERGPGAERLGPPVAAGDRLGPPDRMGPPDRLPPPERMMPPAAASAPVSGRPGGPPPMPSGPPSRDPGYGRYDEPTFAGVEDPYEPGRRGRADMTAEIRMNEPSFGGGPTGSLAPPPPPPRPVAVPPMGAPAGGSLGYAPPTGSPVGPGLSGEAQRLDQMRRTFQLRRFGSGYDRTQVDQLFEGLILGLSGRGPLPGSDAELAPSRFELVPGGYFEAEVDAALKEARDILARRR